MSRSLRARLGLALCAAVVVLLASPWLTPAHATEITGKVSKVGWWTSRAGAQPSATEDGFEVAFGTDGKRTSVAAFDLTVDSAAVQTLQLSLTELAGTGALNVGHLRVCFAAPGWAPANPGELKDAPTITCPPEAADLTRSVDGNWLGDLGAMMPNGGFASLAVVAINDFGAITPGGVYQISKIGVSGQGEPLVDQATTTTTPPPSPGGLDFNQPPVISVDPGGGVTDDLAIPSTPTNDVTDIPAATTTTTTAPPSEFAAPPLPDEDKGPGRPWYRMVFLTPLAAGIGLGIVMTRRFLVDRGMTFS